MTFALTHLTVADANGDGTIDDGEWRQVGFDVDGVVTREGDAPRCKPAFPGEPDPVDGACGVDNTFGKMFQWRRSSARNRRTSMRASPRARCRPCSCA